MEWQGEPLSLSLDIAGKEGCLSDIDEIFGEMLACLEEQTGLEPEPGCDLSVRMYAVAAEVYALYIQAQWVTRQAFPQTAESDYLPISTPSCGD